MLRRQTLISQLYGTGHSILETARPLETHLHSTAFYLRAAPAPAESFRQWLAEASVAGLPAEATPANRALPIEQADKREPGQSTRLVPDNKGQHSTPKNLEGYSS